MFGLTFEKILILGIIAVFVLGPDRLPHYAAQLARLVRSLRDMANGARDRMKEEMGPEFEDVDWKKLDPRQYDPRRIIREALLDDDPFLDPSPESRKPVSAVMADTAATVGAAGTVDTSSEDGRPVTQTTPFDDEST